MEPENTNGGKAKVENKGQYEGDMSF